MSAKVNIELGYRSHRLTVVQEQEPIQRQRRFLCQCDCGNTTVLWLTHLRSGKTKSCGCYLREKARATAIKYFRKPNGVALLNELRRRYTRSAKKRKLEFSLTLAQFQNLVQHPCVFCGRAPYHTMARPGRYGAYTYTGIDRLDAEKGYVPGNCVPCCKICNYAKQTMTLNQFLTWIQTVSKNTKQMNTFDYLDLSKTLTGIPTGTTAPEPLAPAETALEIVKRHAERVKDRQPDVVPSQGAMPIAN